MSEPPGWSTLAGAHRRVALDALLERLPPWLDLVDAEAREPRFVDRRHGDRWRLFPGGAFVMGATPERTLAAEALLAFRADRLWSPEVHRPARELSLAPYLLMEHAARGRDGEPVYFLGEVARGVERLLTARGARLPSDAEWEAAFWQTREAPDGWEVGQMELCADGWRSSQDALPADGRPVPGGPAVCRRASLSAGELDHALPARMPLASVRLCCVRAALDVPLTPR